jgi:hypothetical protein
MARRCPPGVICVENVTILFVLIIVAGIALYINSIAQKKHTDSHDIMMVEERDSIFGLFPRPSFSFSNVSNDVLLNPYQPPLKDDRVFRTDMSDPRGVPINISTRAVDADYRQVGILTRAGGKEMILPLVGRPLYTSRDKWNFYTMSNENSMVKLPITYKNRSCTDEYGCDNLYSGDMVYVQGYNDTFKVTMYDNQVMRYIPYL